jgi:hypothetical protein
MQIALPLLLFPAQIVFCELSGSMTACEAVRVFDLWHEKS